MLHRSGKGREDVLCALGDGVMGLGRGRYRVQVFGYGDMGDWEDIILETLATLLSKWNPKLLTKKKTDVRSCWMTKIDQFSTG